MPCTLKKKSYGLIIVLLVHSVFWCSQFHPRIVDTRFPPNLFKTNRVTLLLLTVYVSCSRRLPGPVCRGSARNTIFYHPNLNRSRPQFVRTLGAPTFSGFRTIVHFGNPQTKFRCLSNKPAPPEFVFFFPVSRHTRFTPLVPPFDPP